MNSSLLLPGRNRIIMRLTAFLNSLWQGPTAQAIWEGTIPHLPLLITSVYALALTAGKRSQEGL